MFYGFVFFPQIPAEEILSTELRKVLVHNQTNSASGFFPILEVYPSTTLRMTGLFVQPAESFDGRKFERRLRKGKFVFLFFQVDDFVLNVILYNAPSSFRRDISPLICCVNILISCIPSVLVVL